MSTVDVAFLSLIGTCLVLIVTTTVLELRGVMDKRKHDTISEMVWWLRDHHTRSFVALMAILAIVMAGTVRLIVWLPGHFLFGGH